MGLDPLSAALAFRGLGVLKNLVGKLGHHPDAQAIEDQLASGEPLSQADFEDLLERLLALVNEAGEDEPVSPSLRGLRAMAEHQKALSPVLFDALDRDGNGSLEGGELRSLHRFAVSVREAAT